MTDKSTEDLPLNGPHWSFAVDLYKRPGVSDACLWLQDTLGIDINVLLLVLFAASERGVALSPSDIAELDRAVAEWRSDVVVALRSVRRQLKAGPPPAPSPLTEALRDSIKSAELRAEQIEQAVLANWIEQNTTPEDLQTPAVGDTLKHVVEFFTSRRGANLDAATHARKEAAMQAILLQLEHVRRARSQA